MLQDWRKVEHLILAPQASFADQSHGRLNYEDDDMLRTCYQRDRDRIIHSKAFRRLKTKTQVFVAIEGDHYRTRLTHTLEVAQISRTVARALCLNEDLTEAIALGHDLGHTPYGHAGERALNNLSGHFAHNEQSLRVVDVLEKLNLTAEVRDGILNHSGGGIPCTLEGRIVHIADRIAYVNHDIDDAIRAGLLTDSDLPPRVLKILGETHRKRIDTLVRDLVANSAKLDDIALSEPIGEVMMELRQFLFDNLYWLPQMLEREAVLTEQLALLYNYYNADFERLPANLSRDIQGVCDYIAGMSDFFATQTYNQISKKL